MPQSESARKRLTVLLGLGGALTLALLAAHYFSPVSRRLAAGADVELVLLSPERPMLFVYHPGSRTVSAVRLPKRAVKSAGSAMQRAHAALSLALRRETTVQDPAYFIEAPDPDLESFCDTLNSWRARPALLLAMAARLRELKSGAATNLPWHDALLLFAELTRLNSSAFVIADLPKDQLAKVLGDDAAEQEAAQAGAPRAPVRLEVLNASGRRDLAERTARYLRKKGFDVISVGNHKVVEKQTKIVNCSNNIAAARQVRGALGLEALEIYSKPEKPAVAQARVILGMDFDAAGVADPGLFGKEAAR